MFVAIAPKLMSILWTLLLLLLTDLPQAQTNPSTTSHRVLLTTGLHHQGDFLPTQAGLTAEQLSSSATGTVGRFNQSARTSLNGEEIEQVVECVRKSKAELRRCKSLVQKRHNILRCPLPLIHRIWRLGSTNRNDDDKDIWEIFWEWLMDAAIPTIMWYFNAACNCLLDYGECATDAFCKTCDHEVAKNIHPWLSMREGVIYSVISGCCDGILNGLPCDGSNRPSRRSRKPPVKPTLSTLSLVGIGLGGLVVMSLACALTVVCVLSRRRGKRGGKRRRKHRKKKGQQTTTLSALTLGTSGTSGTSATMTTTTMTSMRSMNSVSSKDQIKRMGTKTTTSLGGVSALTSTSSPSRDMKRKTTRTTSAPPTSMGLVTANLGLTSKIKATR